MYVDWTPVIVALAAGIPILITSIANYIQVRANNSAIREVHKSVNGGNTALAERMTSIENKELINHPTEVKGE